MTEKEQSRSFFGTKFWHYLPVVIILGFAGFLLYPQIASLTHSWHVVQNMTLWAVILAAASETVSWIGNGLTFHYILKANNQRLSIGRGSLIAIGTLAISLVAGGGVGLAVSYGWLYRESKDTNSAFLAATLPSFFNTGTIIVVSIVGSIYLLIVHDLTRGQLIEFSLGLLMLAAIAVLTLIALRSQKLVERVTVWLLDRWSRIRNKPFSAEETIKDVDKFFQTSKSLAHYKWLPALLGAVVNVGFDMTMMFLLFIAAGHQISVETLFAGYGLPLVLSKLAFMFPGGIGVIEGSMNGLFTSLKVPSDISVVVIMGYRLFSFWIPTILGFLAAAYLSGKLVRHIAERKNNGVAGNE
jgi:uncharacterized protein (TIRG00374 family)